MKPLRYEFLTPDRYPEMFRTFRKAFSDYGVDMSYLTEISLANRWRKNAVSFEASVGAFDGNRMVGFMAVGLDAWRGRRAAFDAGTGVVREFRGFGVGPALFDLAIRGLRGRSVETFVLEVIRSNKAAVGTYKKSGFRIRREFDCYQRLPAPVRPGADDGPAGLVIEPAGRDLLPRFAAFADWLPSWENSFASLDRIPDELRIHGARLDGRWVGFAAYYPGLRWVTNIAVDPAFRRRGIAARLMDRLLGDVSGEPAPVKLINVEPADAATAALAEKAGFAVYARQYEMEREL